MGKRKGDDRDKPRGRSSTEATHSKRSRDGREAQPADGSQGQPSTSRGPSTRNDIIAGHGLFVTCQRGRERKAASDMTALVDQAIDELYPGLVLSENGFPPPVGLKEQGKGADGETVTVRKEEESNGIDVIEEEDASEPIRASIAVQPPIERDLEAQIRAELQELKKASRPAVEKKGRAAAVQRFYVVETGTDCLIFLRFHRDISPLRVAYSILGEVERTGESRSRFILRLEPVEGLCFAGYDEIKQLAEEIIQPHFQPSAPQGAPEGATPLTYRVEPRIRSSGTIHRDKAIPILAEACCSHFAEDAPDRPRADLKNAQRVLLLIVHKNVAGIAVLRDYDRYKKLNLQVLGEVSRGKSIAPGSAAESRVTSALAKTQEQIV